MQRTTRQDTPTRRAVLQAALGLAAAPYIATTARAHNARRDEGRTLVLLHLAGGNDGLNTIIPYADPMYYELRPRLSEAAREVVPIDARVGLHASLRPLVPLFEQGRLAIIQGVGYPDPDYSHVGSCRIWASGERNGGAGSDWWDTVIERAVAQPQGARRPSDASPYGVRSLQRPPAASERPHSKEGAPIAQTLAAIAETIASPNPPPIVCARMDGFDTHADQLPTHARLLRELAQAMATFQETIESRGVADRVLLLAWSEFGRRPAENAAGGTDHGTAGPVFVLGRNVRGGLHGQAPSLTDTDFGNLVHTTDFRDVYATAASRWLGRETMATATTGHTPAFV